MRQALIFTALGLAAGIGMAALFGGSPLPGFGDSDASGRSAPTSEGPLADRIAALETALAKAAQQRAALESDVELLGEQLAALSSAAVEPPIAALEPAAAAAEADADEGSPPERAAARFADRRERASPEYRLNLLLEAGFAPDQAQWIVEREAQLRMEALNAQYEARRQGEPFNPLVGQLASQAGMREQLGDAAYTQYLEAMGRPTSVAVREVLASSPAQAAGLRSGDQIVSYAGQRVFSVVELNELTISGQPGETVAVDILRDGQPMQIYLPRGPIGFTGGGRGFGFGRGGFSP